MSRFFKSKNKAPKAPTPRSLKEIQEAYAPLNAKAGDLSYQIFALKSGLEQLNREMMRLNQEGDARNKLDREAAQAEKQSEKRGP